MVQKVLVGKLVGKRTLGRPSCRWEGSIKTDLKEIKWEIVDCIYLAGARDQLWAL
jgi:hypothetical protein